MAVIRATWEAKAGGGVAWGQWPASSGVERRRRLRGSDRLGPSRQHDAPRTTFGNHREFDVEGQNLAEHAELTHTPRDQLRVLRPEIEDDNVLVVNVMPALRVLAHSAAPFGRAQRARLNHGHRRPCSPYQLSG